MGLMGSTDLALGWVIGRLLGEDDIKLGSLLGESSCKYCEVEWNAKDFRRKETECSQS